MKHFMIKYQLKAGSPDSWHQQVAQFIAELDHDPDLKGRISYLCMRAKDGIHYYHIARAADDQAAQILQQKAFFKRYNEQTHLAGGGEVDAGPLEIIAQTADPILKVVDAAK